LEADFASDLYRQTTCPFCPYPIAVPCQLMNAKSGQIDHDCPA
jgi:hypothetical protein